MKLIKVDTNVIATNAQLKREGRVDLLRPAIVVGNRERPGGPIRLQKGFEVEIHGPCRIVQNDQQETFGARVWIETDADISIR